MAFSLVLSFGQPKERTHAPDRKIGAVATHKRKPPSNASHGAQTGKAQVIRIIRILQKNKPFETTITFVGLIVIGATACAGAS